MPTIKCDVSSPGNLWRKLPTEIQEKVLHYLPSPTDALSLSATDHATHSVVVSALQYWAPHGVVRPPVALDAAPKMWAFQAKSLPPIAKLTVPHLEKPFDIVSKVERDEFTDQSMLAHMCLHSAGLFNSRDDDALGFGEYYTERPREHAKHAGVVTAVGATNEEIEQANRHKHLAGLVGATEESLIQAEKHAKKAGFKMPLLPGKMRSAYLDSIGMRGGRVPEGATDNAVRSLWRSLYPSVVAHFR